MQQLETNTEMYFTLCRARRRRLFVIKWNGQILSFFLSWWVPLFSHKSDTSRVYIEKVSILMHGGQRQWQQQLSATASGWRQERRWIFQMVVSPFSPTAAAATVSTLTAQRSTSFSLLLWDARKEINSFFLPSFSYTYRLCRCYWQEERWCRILFPFTDRIASLFSSLSLSFFSIYKSDKYNWWVFAPTASSSSRKDKKKLYTARRDAAAVVGRRDHRDWSRIFNNHQRAVPCRAVPRRVSTISLHNT